MGEELEQEKLRARLEVEERAYAQFLDALDTLSSFPLPFESRPDLPTRLKELNESWRAREAPGGGSPGAIWARRVHAALAPALEQQAHFNGVAVQVLNEFIDESAALYARLREVVAAVVHYAQAVLPVVDARDRMMSALATSRAELILEAFDRRQEALARRLDGLVAAHGAAPTLALEAGEGALGVLKAQGDGSLAAVLVRVGRAGGTSVTPLLGEARRALRPGGQLRLEHGPSIDVQALSAAVATAGFSDVRVAAATMLLPIPADGLPPGVAQALNENATRLNAVLGTTQEPALVARR
jgi:hypothetical protein